MKIFLSYGNTELSRVDNLNVLNPFTSKGITKGIELKDDLAKTLKEHYNCNIFDYMTCHDPDKGWFELYRDEIINSDVIIFLLGEIASDGQKVERNIIQRRMDSKESIPKIFYVSFYKHPIDPVITSMADIRGVEPIQLDMLYNAKNALYDYIKRYSDGLPSDYYLFKYEKEIIDKFYDDKDFFLKSGLSQNWPNIRQNKFLIDKIIIDKIIIDKPLSIENPILDKVGSFRDFKNNRVLASALTHHHPSNHDYEEPCNKTKIPCPISIGMTFPEAGPRAMIFSPKKANQPRFRIGVIVSGGTAPGINGVINGIVQRHFNYYDGELESNKKPYFKTFINELPYQLELIGFHNGFSILKNPIPANHEKFLRENTCLLFDTNKRRKHDNNHGGRNNNFECRITSKEINRPGSILQTGREISLIEAGNRIALLFNILKNLQNLEINVLYIIGGEGSMRAAHALATISMNNDMGISVCGIPKTMDNDILWVWKTFGFHSAVYKASEFINTLTYELKSNPRIGILQLFGSFSGFVVSHAVLGSKSKICDTVLIPEVSFSLNGLKNYLEPNIQEFRKSLIVMAETVFPDDIETAGGYNLTKNEQEIIDKAIQVYKNGKDKVLSNSKSEVITTETQKEQINEFAREEGRREIQREFSGKGYQVLGQAVLKIIAHYLNENIKTHPDVITNEPKYLIRDISPSPIDIIFGNRLAILAVDNMMAGYTDFMISQWLTEFCLIPLNLVVLGTKKVPKDGIFWKSVIAKTGQPDKLI